MTRWQQTKEFASDAPSPASTPTLIGRERELTTLQKALENAVSGRGQLVLIGGEAGIGKTTLVRWLTAAAATNDVLTLTGTCYDLETTPPYGPWIEILRSCLSYNRVPPPDELINPKAVERLGGTSALYEVASRYFHEVAVEQPLVLVLEDQHWADQPSLEFLRFLIRQIRADPILIVVTYRDVELTPRQSLYHLLPQLVRESQAIRILLRPFDRRAIDQFISSRYDLGTDDHNRLVTYLRRYAEGNPFFTEELLITLEQDRRLREASGSENGHWELSDLSDVKVPSLVRQFISDSFMRLGDDVQHHLQVAAVIGLEIELDLWLEVIEMASDALVHAIEQALEYRFIEEVPGHGSVRFRHTLIRQALYESLILPHRQRWHQRVGEVLMTRGNPDPEIIAHHFRQALDPRAADWLIRSGEVAEQRYAWLPAAERFEAAEQFLKDGGERLQERGWLLHRIALLYRRSDVRRSLALLAEAHTIAQTVDDELLTAQISVNRGLYRCFQGEVASGLSDLKTGVDLLESRRWDTASSASVKIGKSNKAPDPEFRRGILVNWLAVAGRFEEALAMGTEFVSAHTPPAITVASLSRFEDYYDAFIGLGQSYIAFGQPDDARQVLDRAREGYGILERLPWIYFRSEIEYHITYSIDQPVERNHLTEMLTRVWQRSLESINPDLPREYRQAWQLYFDGDWQSAETAAVTTMSHSSSDTTQSDARIVAGLLALHRGKMDRVRNLIHAVLPDGTASVPGNISFTTAIAAQELAAHAAIVSGDLNAALGWIETFERWITESAAIISRPRLELLRARLELSRGNVDQAREHAEHALALAAQPRQPLALQASHRSLARSLIAATRYDEAERHLETAHQIAIACNAPFERAQVQLVQIELAIATGRRGDTELLVRETRKILEALDARVALSELQMLEEQVSSAFEPVPSASSLSPREREVLKLVIDGHTDREIGDELHISPRTVGNHVANILNKLGVNSRAAAAAEAVRQGLV